MSCGTISLFRRFGRMWFLHYHVRFISFKRTTKSLGGKLAKILINRSYVFGKRCRTCAHLNLRLGTEICLSVKKSRFQTKITGILFKFRFMTVHQKCSSSSSSVTCQTTGPKPLPKRFLHTVRSTASSFNWQYPALSLSSSSSFLRLLPRLLVTSICPFIFPSIICFTRQFPRKMWPIQLVFRFLFSYFM